MSAAKLSEAILAKHSEVTHDATLKINRVTFQDAMDHSKKLSFPGLCQAENQWTAPGNWLVQDLIGHYCVKSNDYTMKLKFY